MNRMQARTTSSNVSPQGPPKNVLHPLRELTTRLQKRKIDAVYRGIKDAIEDMARFRHERFETWYTEILKNIMK